MRIISGFHKGRKISAPKKLPVRPTTDMAKEGLFNILTHQIDFEQTSVLDLCCGTGNISFEFASRGCDSITAVDQHRGCVSFVNKICDELDFSIRVVQKNIFGFLQNNTQCFEVVFADPPYDFSNEQYLEIIDLVLNNALSSEGQFILEHESRISFEEHPNFSRVRNYGNSCFSFFEKAGHKPDSV